MLLIYFLRRQVLIRKSLHLSEQVIIEVAETVFHRVMLRSSSLRWLMNDVGQFLFEI